MLIAFVQDRASGILRDLPSRPRRALFNRAPAQTHAPTPVSYGVVEMPTILIVEDFQIVRDTLCETLESDYDCRPVRTAEEGMEVLASEPVDVVITDLKLPGMSGVEFLAELRTLRPELPVIVVTGGMFGMFERDFRDLGAFGYLLKPYLAEEIRSLVGRAVEYGSGGGSRRRRKKSRG